MVKSSISTEEPKSCLDKEIRGNLLARFSRLQPAI